MIRQGKSPDEAMEFLAHTLTTRLIHNPTVALRDAGEAERSDLISLARELFDLDEEDS